jgi:hypothetical protein
MASFYLPDAVVPCDDGRIYNPPASVRTSCRAISSPTHLN